MNFKFKKRKYIILIISLLSPFIFSEFNGPSDPAADALLLARGGGGGDPALLRGRLDAMAPAPAPGQPAIAARRRRGRRAALTPPQQPAATTGA